MKYQNRKVIIISLLWMLLSAAYFYALIVLLLTTNLFSWSPRLDLPTVMTLIALMIMVVALFFVARFTTAKIEIWLSLLTSLTIVFFGIYVLYDLNTETISTGFLNRTALTPLWFKWGIFVLYLLPIIYWFLYPYKVLTNRVAVIK